MPELGRLRSLPNTVANFRVLMAYSDRQLAQRDVVQGTGWAKWQVSRLLRGSEMSDRQMQVLAKFFGFERRRLEWWKLRFDPAEFRRELVRVGYGMFESLDRTEEYLSTLAISQGFFLAEEFLLLLSGERGSYRSFGGEKTEPPEIPAPRGVIGQRYGLALEIAGDARAVAKAVSKREAHCVLLHRDRSEGKLTVAGSGRDCIVGSIDRVFGASGDADDPDEADGAAADHNLLTNNVLVADRTTKNGVTRLGYLIGGDPGRRDVYVFLFTSPPRLGPLWQDVTIGTVVEPNIALALMEAVATFRRDAEESGSIGVMVSHVVFDAVTT
jgi:hypothetical protein